MALINCPECNKKISDKAKACPNCGYPMKLSIVKSTFKDKDENKKFEKKIIKRPSTKSQIKSLAIFVIILVGVIAGSILIKFYMMKPHEMQEMDPVLIRKVYSPITKKYPTALLEIRKGPGKRFDLLKQLQPNEMVRTYDTLSYTNYTIILNPDSTKLGWAIAKHLQSSPLTEEQLEWALLRIRASNRPSVPNSTKSSNNKKSFNTKNVELSLARKLAIADQSGFVLNDNKTLIQLDNLLSQLDRKYYDSREQIANKTLNAQRQLGNFGVNESVLTIMEGMNTINDRNDDRKNYSAYLTIYIVLRKEMGSHNKTISDMQKSIDLVGIEELKRVSGLN